MNILRCAAALCAVGVFSLLGCVSPTAPLISSPQEVSKAGRLSITTYEHDQQTVADHQTGGFEFLSNPNLTTYTLLSPLGQTIANIRLTSLEATIITANQQRFVATGLGADQQVTREALGWPLPLKGLSNLLTSQEHSNGKTWDLANGWQAETLESVANKARRLRLNWQNQAIIDSERLVTDQTKTNLPEIGRIAVLMVINE